MATKNTIPSQKHDAFRTNFRFTVAHGTTVQNLLTVATGQENETHVYSIVVNNRSASRVIHWFINDGVDDVYIGSSTIPANGTAPMLGFVDPINNRMAPDLQRVHFDEKQQPYLRLIPGDVLKASLSAAVGTNNDVFMSITGSRFSRSV